MSKRTWILLLLAFSILSFGLPAVATAAVPASAPSVSVARRAEGGYLVTWTGVSGATGYRVSYETPIRQYDGSTSLVTGSRMSYLIDVNSTVRSVVVSDFVSSEVNAYYLSAKFGVAAYNSSGFGAVGAARARCANGYYIAARGSGQNPTSSGDGSYSQGLGDRGYRIYEDARVRLGLSRSMFQANMVNYPAHKVNWALIDRTNYNTSKDNGVNVAMSQVSNIASHCPSARIILFGYSQGGHAIGDAVQRLAATTRDNITQAVLFAEAARNPNDSAIQYRPLAVSGHGIMGTRAGFTGLTDRLQVSSWCHSSDDVCSLDGNPSTFHGSAYDCYEDWAADGIAARARNVGWRTSANSTNPSCVMTS